MPDALNTIFVEVQGSTMDDVRKLGLSRKWFGNGALWTTERPCESPGKGIPAFVLLSPDGEVVMSGDPLAMHGEIEDYIEEQRRGRARFPDDMPKKLKRAWKALQKNDYEKALKEVVKHVDASDATLAEKAKALETEIREQARAAVTRLERAIDEGHYHESLDRLEDIVDELGDEQAISKAEALIEKLESDAMEDEIDADKTWIALRTRLFEDGMDDRMAAHLQRFTEKFAGTKAAERASVFTRAAGE